MQVYFFDCEKNENCLSVPFFSGYKLDDDVDLATMNEWNTERRFGRAHKTDGAARIEIDIAAGHHGIHVEDFGELHELWLESVGVFEEKINW